jgi:tetratricopeptide (TPR) repeat protein
MAEITNLKEAYKTIKQLIKEEKWLEAHRACLEMLRFDPENLKIIHLKNKIEKNVKKNNKKSIKSDIEKLKPLWSEHKYEELLQNLKKLEPYIKDYPGIKSLILKATKKYENSLRSEQEKEYLEETKKVEELKGNHKYQEALLIAEKLRIIGIHTPELKKIILKIRTQWIHHEMDENRFLLNGTKYEDALLFLQRLLKIDQTSEKVKSSIEETKKAYKAYKIEEKKEFIYKGLENIRTLYQLKKFEKAYEACGEILEIDPQNKSALSFQNLSSKKAQKIIDNEVITQMIANQKNLKSEFKTNKKSFIRI